MSSVPAEKNPRLTVSPGVEVLLVKMVTVGPDIVPPPLGEPATDCRKANRFCRTAELSFGVESGNSVTTTG